MKGPTGKSVIVISKVATKPHGVHLLIIVAYLVQALAVLGYAAVYFLLCVCDFCRNGA